MKMGLTRRFLLVATAAAVGLASLLGCASASATAPPSIEGESASKITPTDATLEAQIDPGGSSAYYQFQLSEDPSEFADEIFCPPLSETIVICDGPPSETALPIRYLSANEGPAGVALDLADAGVALKPEKTYYFRVVAASAKPTEDTIEWEKPVVGGQEMSFTTGAAPSIISEGVSAVTPTDATLEAQIDPGDAADGVYYQFQIASDLGEYVTEIVCPPEPPSGPARPCIGAHSSDALPIGFLAAGSGPSSVSLDLAGAGMTLQPGTSYQYRVLVAKAVLTEDTIEWEAPSIVGAVQGFTTPAQPPPATDPEPQAGGAGQQPAGQSPSPAQPPRHHRRHRRKHNRRQLHRSNVGQASLAR